MDTGDIDPERTANEEVREHGAGRGGRQVLVGICVDVCVEDCVGVLVEDCMGV